MNENWCVLAIAAYYPSDAEFITVQQAFYIYDHGYDKYKLTKSDVFKIIQLIKSGHTRREVARQFNISTGVLDYKIKKVKQKSEISQYSDELQMIEKTYLLVK
ncbi:MAG: hypothetical protein LKF87_10160 [Clostridium tyrobutyricum]|jgi:DNA-binding NarL/FixJ family response regulator|uniref:hypothetical protein n=1 Tax=Clostridium tyrobutyricum TaxID=1519 RepID=UPI00242CA41E|nr:hypothetical protein [Clostridium tyrobutyricum]MCH4237518.1 hypothetical protein [Clostridium tyrobutyricum]MCH4259313.1 hypothetical protein [Clostridium tyrobutyricum]